MEIPEERAGAANALAKLQEVLGDPEKRTAFSDDAEGTFERAGGQVRDIPAPAWEALKSLEPDELKIVTEVGERFTAAGLYIDLPGGGTVCFF